MHHKHNKDELGKSKSENIHPKEELGEVKSKTAELRERVNNLEAQLDELALKTKLEFKTKGEQFFKDKNYNAARECFLKSIVLDDTGTSEHNVGLCYYHEKNYEQAKNYFSAAAAKALSGKAPVSEAIKDYSYSMAKRMLAFTYLKEDNIPLAVAALLCDSLSDGRASFVLETIPASKKILSSMPKSSLLGHHALDVLYNCLQDELSINFRANKEVTDELASLMLTYEGQEGNGAVLGDCYTMMKQFNNAIRAYNQFIAYAMKKDDAYHRAWLTSIYIKLAEAHCALKQQNETSQTYGYILLSFYDCSIKAFDNIDVDALADKYNKLLSDQNSFHPFYFGILHLQPEDQEHLFKECLGLNPQTSVLSNVLHQHILKQKSEKDSFLSSSAIGLAVFMRRRNNWENRFYFMLNILKNIQNIMMCGRYLRIY